jgi:hypothetical protein
LRMAARCRQLWVDRPTPLHRLAGRVADPSGRCPCVYREPVIFFVLRWSPPY